MDTVVPYLLVNILHRLIRSRLRQAGQTLDAFASAVQALGWFADLATSCVALTDGDIHKWHVAQAFESCGGRGGANSACWIKAEVSHRQQHSKLRDDKAGATRAFVSELEAQTPFRRATASAESILGLPDPITRSLKRWLRTGRKVVRTWQVSYHRSTVTSARDRTAREVSQAGINKRTPTGRSR